MKLWSVVNKDNRIKFYNNYLTDVRVLPFNSFPATVVVEKHGMNGTICSENWDNTDADVLCRQLSYSGGVAFGPQYSGSSTPMWMSNVQCNGTEKTVQSCKFDMTPSTACLSNHMSARIYCYNGEGKILIEHIQRSGTEAIRTQI